ncbi:hypothetical protein CP082626L3_0217A, partial [Chlamydia psittaci 08-2626_L3]|jgi:hypothetical protein
MTLS